MSYARWARLTYGVGVAADAETSACAGVPEPRLLSRAQLEQEGQALGRELPPGAVVFLEGELGAGKTTLARAIARGLGVTEPVSSPTYALVHHHETPDGPVYHLDCYRLRSPDDAADLDWATLESARALLLEWPERAGAWAPRPTHRIRLARVPGQEALRSWEAT